MTTRRASLGIIFLTILIDMIGFGIVIPVLPIYAETFHATPVQNGLLVAIFSFAQFIAAPFWGKRFESLPRTRVLMQVEWICWACAATVAVQELGGAAPGDKTLIDVLTPALAAYGNAAGRDDSFEACLSAMDVAAGDGLDATRDMMAKVGRAARLGERSRGTTDPGAASCPFCPGHEEETPPALETYGTDGRWLLRVVPNRYPAFSGSGELEVEHLGPLFAKAPATGIHEVLILTPEHRHSWADLDDRQVGLVMSARIAPGFFLAPAAGVLVDRWDRKKVMVVCDLGRALTLACLPFITHVWHLLLASLLLEVFTLLWSPAKEASVPNLVPSDRLTSANSLSLVAAYGTFPVASLLFAGLEKIGDHMAHLSGLSMFRFGQAGSMAVYVDVLTFVASALFISTLLLPPSRRSQHAELGVDFNGPFRELREGWRFMFTDRVVRAVMLALATGLIVSILQAATQINEQTLSFVPKLIVIFGTLLFVGPWMITLLTDYIRRLYESIPSLIG